MEYLELVKIVFPSLLALLGGFLGGRLTRQTEFEKWHRQQQGLAFADLLRRMHEVRTEAAKTILSCEGTMESRTNAGDELFTDFTKFEAVARLYMRPTERKKLSKLLKEFWQFCRKTDPHIEATNSIQDQIRDLIEGELGIFPKKTHWFNRQWRRMCPSRVS